MLQVVQSMGSINESSRKIVDIMGVIDGIAFQTNILALNAAVEAGWTAMAGKNYDFSSHEVISGDHMKSFKRIKSLAAAASLLAGLAGHAHTAEVAGVKLDDTIKVANQELILNGAGVRTWAIFKVYAAGLYLSEKKKTVPEIMAVNGPRRIKLVLLRDVNNEELGQAFMDGLNANSDKAEKAKFVNQTVKMGEIFASIPKLTKGDTIVIDWIPGSGMHVFVNDKRVGEVLPDLAFYNAFMRIWLGEKPVDNALKQALLGS